MHHAGLRLCCSIQADDAQQTCELMIDKGLDVSGSDIAGKSQSHSMQGSRMHSRHLLVMNVTPFHRAS